MADGVEHPFFLVRVICHLYVLVSKMSIGGFCPFLHGSFVHFTAEFCVGSNGLLLELFI